MICPQMITGVVGFEFEPIRKLEREGQEPLYTRTLLVYHLDCGKVLKEEHWFSSESIQGLQLPEDEAFLSAPQETPCLMAEPPPF